MKTVLMVDDQVNVHVLVRDYLTQEGFRVVEAENGRQALQVARQADPDVILLDVMMPEMNGFAFIPAYRKEGIAPIILLTAKQEESDKVLGLELGADDYLTKPFGMRELVARINAVLRRAVLRRAVLRRAGGQVAAPRVVRAADIVLDRGAHTVTVAGRHVGLTTSPQ